MAGTGIVVHSMHPGWADTAGIQHAMPVFRKVVGPILRSDAEGADTIVWLGAAARAAPVHRQAVDGPRDSPDPLPVRRLGGRVEAREELWKLCERLANAA